jgi:hypothetical protein
MAFITIKDVDIKFENKTDLLLRAITFPNYPKDTIERILKEIDEGQGRRQKKDISHLISATCFIRIYNNGKAEITFKDYEKAKEFYDLIN